MIEIQELRKTYGDHVAVDGLSLTVNAGEIFGLVGPNGAGKTSTLRCLAGILPPTSGHVRVDGFDLEADPVEARRRLAFVADEPRLFEHLTVRDYMKVLARLYGVEDGVERSEALLEELELGDRHHSFPDELSRGMKQKLMVAGALLHRPRALIFDEPLTGLDPGAMRRMKTTIRRTASEGTAVLVSSHLLSLVEEMCDRVLILQRGREVLSGTLKDIRAGLPDLDPDADLETIFLRATGMDQPTDVPAAGQPASETPA